MKKKKINKVRRNMHIFYADMNLFDVSTPRQIVNGTKMYKDTRLKNVWYTFHESGYYRRRTLLSPINTHFCGRNVEHYQLNRTHQVYDKEWNKYCTKRILIMDITEQMILAVHAIELYRLKHGVI